MGKKRIITIAKHVLCHYFLMAAVGLHFSVKFPTVAAMLTRSESVRVGGRLGTDLEIMQSWTTMRYWTRALWWDVSAYCAIITRATGRSWPSSVERARVIIVEQLEPYSSHLLISPGTSCPRNSCIQLYQGVDLPLSVDHVMSAQGCSSEPLCYPLHDSSTKAIHIWWR